MREVSGHFRVPPDVTITTALRNPEVHAHRYKTFSTPDYLCEFLIVFEGSTQEREQWK